MDIFFLEEIFFSISYINFFCLKDLFLDVYFLVILSDTISGTNSISIVKVSS